MAHTGFILLSNLASQMQPNHFKDNNARSDCSDKIVIGNVQETAELYSLLHQDKVSAENNDIAVPLQQTNELDSIEVVNSLFSVERYKNDNIDSDLVTHIEIIKSLPGGSRRITGANRVVPLLTSVWQSGRNEAVESSLAVTYRTYLTDIPNLDDRQCEICKQHLLSSTDVEYHVKEVHNMRDVTSEQCFVCRKKYVFKPQLKYHLSLIHGIQYPELICKICFMEFNTAMEQKAHERKHECTHTCQICTAKFRSEYFFQDHYNSHLVQLKPNECKKCGRRFKNKMSLAIHQKRHNNVSCFLCVTDYQDEIQLLLHIKDHNPDEKREFLKKIEEMDQNESDLEGILEEYVRRSSGQLQEGHTITQSVQECMNDMLCAVSSINSNQTNVELGKKKGIECKLCGIEVTTAKELLDHRRKSHLRNRTCPFCGKRNRSVSQTWRHMSTHISRKKNEVNTTLTQQNKNKDHNKLSVNKDKYVKKTSYKCNICFQKFQYSGSRDKHVLLHSKNDTNSWKCTICNQVFLQPKLLLKHMSHHESQIKCHMCSEVFSKHNLLRVHLKSHFPDEGKKRFKCGLCPVYCSTPSGLQVHHRIHTGERPYTCGQCDKKFKRVQAVKKHIRAVHGGQNLEDHNCCSCSMKFTSAGNLIRHFLRIHRQVRRYVCGICGARFSQNQDLRRHFKVTYKVEMPVISGIDRKALNEIYVIPSIDNLPDSHPHALKINQIVAEEKQKFKGVAELLNQKKVGTERSAVETKIDTLQHSTNHIYNSPSSSSTDIVDKENSSSSSHLPTYTATTNMKLPSCDKCHKVFIGEREYNLHRKSHLCKECEKNFCDEISLQEHMKLHTKKFKCQICMVEFDDKVSFLKHTSEFDEVIVPGEIQRICPNTVSSHKPLQVLISEMPAAEQDVSTRTIGRVLSSEDNYIEVINSTVTNTVGLDEVVRVSGSKQLVTNKDISSVVNTLMPATVNLDSMVCSNIDFYVRNIIIQPTPTFVQPVPFTYAAQNTLAATPIITLQPAALSTHVPEDQQTQSLMPLNDLRNVMMLNGLDSLHIPLQPPTELYTENLNPPGILMSHIPLDMLTTRDPAPVLSNTEFTEEQVEETHVDQRNTNEILTKQTEQETITKEPDKPQGHAKLLCTLCGEQCSSLNSLSRHLKIHTKEKPFSCSQCGKSFSEKHNMKVHLRIHTGERPYTCEECGKQLRYQNDVVDHKRMHLGEKMFVCEECGRKFLRRRELTRHKVTHTGEKRYKCPICSKAFARLDQLKFIHMPTHDDIRVLHKCPICNKSFMQKSSLKQHEILHSGQNKHQCPHCNKTFARGTYLRAHLQTHKKQNEYIQCPKCPRRFTSKDTLQVHEISLHARLHKKNSSTTRKLWKKKSLGNSGDQDNPISEVESTLGMMDIEIQDVDLNIIEGDQCNTVIYLHMEGTEDLKFTLNGVNNELLDE